MRCTDRLYLREDIQFEPLVNGWYSWPLLIAPATAAMVINNHHLRIMESFVRAPELNREAARNPAMRGGPFMDYAGDVAHIRDLITTTRAGCADLLALAAAIKELDQRLAAEAKGASLADLYPRVPPLLRGLVELGYDLANTPSFRLIEALLYRSRFYLPSLQTLLLSVVKDDSRPFALSTPRLPSATEVQLRLPFHSKDIDTLASMKKHPVDASFVDLMAEEFVEGGGAGRDLFRSFFTESPAAVASEDRNYSGPGVRVRYFGHACVLLETSAVTVLTDPVISYPVEGAVPRYNFRDLPDRIDYVMLTHAHQDHVLFETLLQLRHKVGTWIVPRNSGGSLQDPSLKQMLQILGFGKVVELDELETIATQDGAITGLPFFGEHGDLHIRTKLAFHVQLKGTTFLFAADSNNLEPGLYDALRSALGAVDHLFIGMECDGAPMSWLYGPLFTKPIDRKADQSRRLNGSNFERALGIVQRLTPKSVYVYAMGQEPWLGYISSISYTSASAPIVESDKLVAECKRRGLATKRLFGRETMLFDTSRTSVLGTGPADESPSAERPCIATA